MDPRTIEINNLRVLNDYLNQTLDVLTRTTRAGYVPTMGLSHSPYAASLYGASPFNAYASTIDPTLVGGLTHTAGVAPFAVGTNALNAFSPVVDPWGITRGLSHTQQAFSPAFNNPVADMWRQQNWQRALQAQQLQTIATLRAMGCPV